MSSTLALHVRRVSKLGGPRCHEEFNGCEKDVDERFVPGAKAQGIVRPSEDAQRPACTMGIFWSFGTVLYIDKIAQAIQDIFQENLLSNSTEDFVWQTQEASHVVMGSLVAVDERVR